MGMRRLVAVQQGVDDASPSFRGDFHDLSRQSVNSL